MMIDQQHPATVAATTQEMDHVTRSGGMIGRAAELGGHPTLISHIYRWLLKKGDVTNERLRVVSI